MKNLFKICKITLFAFFANTTKSNAQTGPVECSVKYSYDVAGNRIERRHSCENTWTPWDTVPWTESPTILTSVFPNPTIGPLTGVFSETIGGEAGPALVSISTLGGIEIFYQEYNYLTTTINLDISQQIPGQYFLTIAAFNKVETYVITKL